LRFGIYFKSESNVFTVLNLEYCNCIHVLRSLLTDVTPSGHVLPLLPSNQNVHLLIVLYVDNLLLPLASWYLALEQNVNLTIGETLHLR